MTEGRPTREKERASLGKTRHREKAPTHRAGGPAGARGASEKPVPVPAQTRRLCLRQGLTERGGDGDATAVGGDADAPPRRRTADGAETGTGGDSRPPGQTARQATERVPDRGRLRSEKRVLWPHGKKPGPKDRKESRAVHDGGKKARP